MEDGKEMDLTATKVVGLAPSYVFLKSVQSFMLRRPQVVSQLNPTTGKVYHASVNACLAPLVSVDGKHVITVEGIGNVKDPHPAQERIALGSGSQCGFCTPGIVMVRRLPCYRNIADGRDRACTHC